VGTKSGWQLSTWLAKREGWGLRICCRGRVSNHLCVEDRDGWSGRWERRAGDVLTDSESKSVADSPFPLRCSSLSGCFCSSQPAFIRPGSNCSRPGAWLRRSAPFRPPKPDSHCWRRVPLPESIPRASGTCGSHCEQTLCEQRETAPCCCGTGPRPGRLMGPLE
jgi:hypothetical protein